MIKLFCGYDTRESIGFHIFIASVLENTSTPVSFIPITKSLLNRHGTNTFTYSRFLIPSLCDHEGWAIYADASDMLCMADISELWRLKDHYKAVQVVKHDYMTKHPRKYLGTSMEAPNENYPRKNWSSLILWNCGHFKNRILTTEYVSTKPGVDLHRFSWLDDELIGGLHSEWNWLVGEYHHNDQAKILHYTLGMPGFAKYRQCDHSTEWHDMARKVKYGTEC